MIQASVSFYVGDDHTKLTNAPFCDFYAIGEEHGDVPADLTNKVDTHDLAC